MPTASFQDEPADLGQIILQALEDLDGLGGGQALRHATDPKGPRIVRLFGGQAIRQATTQRGIPQTSPTQTLVASGIPLEHPPRQPVPRQNTAITAGGQSGPLFLQGQGFDPSPFLVPDRGVREAQAQLSRQHSPVRRPGQAGRGFDPAAPLQNPALGQGRGQDFGPGRADQSQGLPSPVSHFGIGILEPFIQERDQGSSLGFRDPRAGQPCAQNLDRGQACLGRGFVTVQSVQPVLALRTRVAQGTGMSRQYSQSRDTHIRLGVEQALGSGLPQIGRGRRGAAGQGVQGRLPPLPIRIRQGRRDRFSMGLGAQGPGPNPLLSRDGIPSIRGVVLVWIGPMWIDPVRIS